MGKVAAGRIGSDGWWARTRRSTVVLVVASVLSACSTWMDREVVDRELPAEWAEAEASTRTPDGVELRYTAPSTGIYRLSGGALRHAGPQVQRNRPVGDWWTGHIGATGPATFEAATEQFVLAAGDEVHFRWAGAASPVVPLRLEVRRNVAVEIEDMADGAPQLVFEEVDGRWTLAVSQSAAARPSRRVQEVERSPSSYDTGAGTCTAEELDRTEALQWFLFAPAGVGRLISRALGARLEEPRDFLERVVDERSVEQEETVPCRVPVAGASFTWKLLLPKYEDGKVVDVTTATTGRATIDFRDYLAAIDERIDLGQSGRLQVTDQVTNTTTEQAVDLLRIRDAARASAGDKDGARGGEGDKAPTER
jgi:hypothetical protein